MRNILEFINTGKLTKNNELDEIPKNIDEMCNLLNTFFGGQIIKAAKVKKLPSNYKIWSHVCPGNNDSLFIKDNFDLTFRDKHKTKLRVAEFRDGLIFQVIFTANGKRIYERATGYLKMQEIYRFDKPFNEYLNSLDRKTFPHLLNLFDV